MPMIFLQPLMNISKDLFLPHDEAGRELADTQAELERVRGRLAQIEDSTAYQAANVLRKGASRPRRALIVVPRELLRLYRRWRTRRGRKTPSTLVAPSSVS